MEVQQDFKELLGLFNKYGVKYIIVGGYALAFHGAPRYTGDIDIFVKNDKKNAQKIISALNDFGFSSLGLKSDASTRNRGRSEEHTKGMAPFDLLSSSSVSKYTSIIFEIGILLATRTSA